MIAIYRAAKRVGIKIKHRFVSNQTALLVSGPHGEFVINDLVEGMLIENEENSCSGWGQFMGEVEKIPGCWREASVDKNEEVGPVME